MRGMALLMGGLLLAVPAAAGNHEPPSDAGEMPMTFAFAKTGPDAGIRTSVIVTGGAGPSVQRIVYGTADSTLHLQTLERGSPIGPGGADSELGIDLDDGPVNDAAAFGSATGTVNPVDTSTEERLGHLIAAHNDNGAVHIALVNATTGAVAKVGQAVPDSLGCSVNSTPALTPPDESGDRLLFTVVSGSACRVTGVLRHKVTGALAGEAGLGPVELIPIADVRSTASPEIVYLESGGAIRPFVAVSTAGRVLFYSATAPVQGLQPTFTVPLPAGELPESPVAPHTASGLPAGAVASGVPRAHSVYVSAQVGAAESRIHRIVQHGDELVIQASSPTLTGVPAPSLATSEIAEGAGTRPGRIVLTTVAAAHVLDSATLAPVGSLPGGGATNELGFSRTSATISGGYAYLARDNGEPVILRMADARRVAAPLFTPVKEHTTAASFGAPAVSRGTVVWGSDTGAFAYRNRDVTPPAVALTAPSASSILAGTVIFAARAGDARGIKQVDFRLIDRHGNPKVVARDSAPDDGSPFLIAGAMYTGTVRAGALGSGAFIADVAVTDMSGNVTFSAQRRVRIKGRNRAGGRCRNRLLGGPAADLLTGTRSGDRIHGRGGRDVLRGQGGNDCLYGEGGSDELVGGSGADRLHGGAGNDFLDARDGRRDTLDCGRGRDKARVDRADRVKRCERVLRKRS